MLYSNAQDYLNAQRKSVALFGMSGTGKTVLSSRLRDTGNWFHYSIDYRIATRYLSEAIVDNFKEHAMQVPFLRELLMSDSIYIGSNVSFDNLAPLSTWLGKPGAIAKGGIEFNEYQRRQMLHLDAEIAATKDVGHFFERAERIYGYPHFITDCSGSLCEVVDPHDENDPTLTKLSETALPVWIRGEDSDKDDLIARFAEAPKPMYYRADFLEKSWHDYLAETGKAPDEVDPDNFIRWGYAKLLDSRLPRYDAMAKNWGVTILARDVAEVRTADQFDTLVARAIDEKGAV